MKTSTREASKLSQCRLEAVREALVEYRAKKASQRCLTADVMGSVGDTMGERVQPTAQSELKLNLIHVHGYFGEIQARIAKVLKAKGHNTIGKATKQRLLKVWSDCNIHVRKEQCHALSARGDTYRESPCHSYHMCVEGRTGVLTMSMNAAWNTIVRRHLFATAATKDLALTAKAFLLVQGERQADSNDEVGCSRFVGNFHGEYALLWLHIGSVRQKPSFRCLVQVLQCDVDPVPMGSTVALRGAWVFPNQSHVLAALNKTWRWSVRAFVREDVRRLVDRIRSQNVLARELNGIDGDPILRCFWDGSSSIVRAMRVKQVTIPSVPRPRREVGDGRVGEAVGSVGPLGVEDCGAEASADPGVSHLDKEDADELLDALDVGVGGGRVPKDDELFGDGPYPLDESVDVDGLVDPLIDGCPEPDDGADAEDEYSPESPMMDPIEIAEDSPSPSPADPFDSDVEAKPSDEPDGKSVEYEPTEPDEDPDGELYDGEEVVTVQYLEYGTLIFYPSVGDFYAVCKAHGHRCRMVRTSAGSDNKPSQGRPLGLLAAWLERGPFDDAITDMESHKKVMNKIDYEARSDARNFIRTLPSGITLLRCERRRIGDEPAEPTERP